MCDRREAGAVFELTRVFAVPHLVLRNAIAFGTVALAFFTTTLLHMHHSVLVQQQAFHGWDRSVEVVAIAGTPKIAIREPGSGEIIASFTRPFNWGRIVSAPALAAVRALPSVESVHRFMAFHALVDEAGRPIVVSIVDPDFVEAFRLGDPSLLGSDLHLAASSSNDAGQAASRYSNRQLEFKLVSAPGHSPELAAMIANSPPVRSKLGAGVFSARPLWFSSAQQFYASSAWVDALAGSADLSIPSVELAIKLRSGVPLDSGINEIQAVLDRFPSNLLFKGNVAHARPLLQAYSTDKARSALLRAGRWIPLAMAGVFALIGLVIIWLRFRALSLELALRRGFGQSRWQAALSALRPEIQALGVAMGAACLIAWIWFAVQGHPWAVPKLWPAAALGVAAGAGLSLLLARTLVQGPTALLLKRHTG